MQPQLVPPVLRVGVTGHRPDSAKRPEPDIAAIRRVVVGVLMEVRHAVDDLADRRGDLFATSDVDGQTRTRRNLRLISALAPGPDQWVASEAVGLGFDLQCVLPFSRQDYLKDFEAQPEQAEYRRLLGLASVVFEPDEAAAQTEGEARISRDLSYQAAGRAVLRQSDLLLALWDGQPAQGNGGTGQVVDEALARGIPILWIPWSQPEAWRLLLRPREDSGPGAPQADQAGVQRLIEKLLLPPL